MTLNELKKFECQIEFFGQKTPVDKNFLAYSMDDGLQKRLKNPKYPDMRLWAAKTGTCSCCDYMQIRNDGILLIEETDIALQKNKFEAKNQGGWTAKEVANCFDKMIRREFTKKLYGALLTLYWLDGYNNLNLDLEHKKIDFALIHNDNYDKRGSDALKNKLETAIKGELKEKIQNVHVMSAVDAKAILRA